MLVYMLYSYVSLALSRLLIRSFANFILTPNLYLHPTNLLPTHSGHTHFGHTHFGPVGSSVGSSVD